MAKHLIVQSTVKDIASVEGKKLEVSADFYPELEKKVEMLIKEACKRAVANKRNTVMAKDV